MMPACFGGWVFVNKLDYAARGIAYLAKAWLLLVAVPWFATLAVKGNMLADVAVVGVGVSIVAVVGLHFLSRGLGANNISSWARDMAYPSAFGAACVLVLNGNIGPAVYLRVLVGLGGIYFFTELAKREYVGRYWYTGIAVCALTIPMVSTDPHVLLGSIVALMALIGLLWLFEAPDSALKQRSAAKLISLESRSRSPRRRKPYVPHRPTRRDAFPPDAA